MSYDAIVLAGGRSQRLGVDKATFEVGGRRLVDAALAAVAGASRTILVGPDGLAPGVATVREEPPFGGPVAGILAALPLVESEQVVVLACDLPRAPALLPLVIARFRALSRRKVAESGQSPDGVVPVDAAGRVQWLAGLYRTAALREAAARMPEGGRGASVRALVAGLDLALLPDPAGLTRDIDTWDDVTGFEKE